jgi:hypothetical protein
MPRRRIKPPSPREATTLIVRPLSLSQLRRIEKCGLPPAARDAVIVLARQMHIDEQIRKPTIAERKAALNKLLPKVVKTNAELSSLHPVVASMIDLEDYRTANSPSAAFSASLVRRVSKDLKTVEAVVRAVLASMTDKEAPLTIIANDPASLLRKIFDAFGIPFDLRKRKPNAVDTLHALMNFFNPGTTEDVAKNNIRRAIKHPQEEFAGLFIGPLLQRISKGSDQTVNRR